jgi:hypothetical protein
MKTFYLPILFFLSGLSVCLGQELTVFSAVGGSSKDNYYGDGIKDFRDAFSSLGVAKEKQHLYFGGPDREGRCISTYPGVVDGKNVSEYRQSIIDAKTCNDFRITLGLRFLTGINLPKPKDCISLAENFLKPADASVVLREMSKGDYGTNHTAYIHLADHGGDKSYGDGDWVINMSNKDSIKSENLVKEVQKILEKGAKVQLSFDACYSGGFTDAVYRLKNELKKKGMNVGRRLCSSSSTESKYAGYDSDPLLKGGFSDSYFKAIKKYGNQLSALACASGADSLNTPVTTLDRFIEEKKLNVRNDIIEDECFHSFYDDKIMNLHTFVTGISNIGLKLKIDLLVKDFHQFYGSVMKECYKENSGDLKVAMMINQCLPDDHQYAHILKPFLNKASQARSYDKKNLLRHITAIESIGNESELAEYLDEFCCLAMPLDKNKKGPASCD